MRFPFNLRVYGIVHDQGRILVTREHFRSGLVINKFPGGGVEFGEGIVDALKRELDEELRIKDPSLDHFYTTDFFQRSAFNEDEQLIAVYYSCPFEAVDLEPIEYADEAEDVRLLEKRWVEMENINPQLFTFPVDKYVAELILSRKDSFI